MSFIYKHFFPVGGGGSLRRLLRIRKEIYKKHLLDTEHPLKSPITLLDFNILDDEVDALRFNNPNNNKNKNNSSTSGKSSLSADGGWRISDDEVIGGFSNCTFRLIRNMNEYKSYMNGGDDELQKYILENNNNQKEEKEEKDDEKEKEEEKQLQEQQYEEEDDEKDDNENEKNEEDNDDNNNDKKTKDDSDENNDNKTKFQPFIRWTGNIDTDIGTSTNDNRIIKSGFASIRLPEFTCTPFFNYLDIKNTYNALEITCRPHDDRLYTINLKVSTYFPDDLYQSYIQLQSTELNKLNILNNNDNNETNNNNEHNNDNNLQQQPKFVRVILPFKDFILTCNGRERDVQRILDGLIKIESIGITLMDNIDGPFTFDIAKVRCVNYYYNEILGEDDKLAPYPY